MNRSGELLPRRVLRLASAVARICVVYSVAASIAAIPLMLFFTWFNPGLAIGIAAVVLFLVFGIVAAAPLYKALLDQARFICLRCSRRAARFELWASHDGHGEWRSAWEFRCEGCGHVDA